MMQNTAQKPDHTLDTWANNQAEEDGMNEGHHHIWQRIIAQCGRDSFTDARILDFGCNQGGFLRLLNREKPFLEGVGVDIAESSVAIAQSRVPQGAPLSYRHVRFLDSHRNYFDVAFSHEVIYLLPDLDLHAQTIHDSLKNDGVYFAATGCYTENPLWPQWRNYIASYSNLPVPDYSIRDYTNAFMKAGFRVEARALRLEDFLEYNDADRAYFPTVLDHLNYHHNHKILFRLTKRNG